MRYKNLRIYVSPVYCEGNYFILLWEYRAFTLNAKTVIMRQGEDPIIEVLLVYDRE